MRFLWLCIPLALCIGCGTVQEHRIRQYSRDFATLPEETKNRVRAGIIQLGDTTLEVYLALGYAKTEEQSEPSGDTIWKYWVELEARPDLPAEPRYRFYSQNEMRFPALSKLHELTLTFREGHLIEYNTKPASDAF